MTDGTEERKDTSQTEDTSSETKGTSTETPTYTEESEKKAVSDALSTAGRDAKSIKVKTDEAERLVSDARKIADTAKGERIKWQKERDDAELEAHRDEPDAIKSIQARQRLQERDTELSKKESELEDSKKSHQEALDKLAESDKEKNALEIAIKHNVPFEKLLKFTDGSTEQMEELAQSLPKSKKTEEQVKKPDSGTTAGGGEKSEQDKLDARYPKMK